MGRRIYIVGTISRHIFTTLHNVKFATVNSDKWLVMQDGYAWKIAPAKGWVGKMWQATRVNSGEWYHATNKHDKKEYIFRCPFEPTEATHGHIFGYTTGGWSTLEILRKHIVLAYSTPANFIFDEHSKLTLKEV